MTSKNHWDDVDSMTSAMWPISRRMTQNEPNVVIRAGRHAEREKHCSEDEKKMWHAQEKLEETFEGILSLRPRPHHLILKITPHFFHLEEVFFPFFSFFFYEIIVILSPLQSGLEFQSLDGAKCRNHMISTDNEECSKVFPPLFRRQCSPQNVIQCLWLRKISLIPFFLAVTFQLCSVFIYTLYNRSPHFFPFRCFCFLPLLLLRHVCGGERGFTLPAGRVFSFDFVRNVFCAKKLILI